MDSDDCDSDTELYIYSIYKAYLRKVLCLRKYAFVCFENIRP